MPFWTCLTAEERRCALWSGPNLPLAPRAALLAKPRGSIVPQLRTAHDTGEDAKAASAGGRSGARGTRTADQTPRLKLALCASGGGHVRQILDLEPVWRAHNFFFVTEDLALGRSIGAEHRTMYVAHFALGQARLGNPFRMLGAAARNLWQSLQIVLRERPDVVLTTGAGSMLFVLLFARMAGARIILIDSIARFNARPLSPVLRGRWPMPALPNRARRRAPGERKPCLTRCG